MRFLRANALRVLMLTSIVSAGCDGGAVTADAGPMLDAATIDAMAADAETGDDAATLDAAMTADASADDAAVAVDAASDGAVPSDGGEADATVPETGADTCELARDVTAGGAFPGQSTRAPATDDYAPMGAGCPSGGAASGRDVAYVVRPAAATTYRVRATPSAATPAYDPMLYAVRTCGAPGCVAGTVLNGPGQPEEITFAVDAAETVFIVVDGELASSGDFDLTVTIE